MKLARTLLVTLALLGGTGSGLAAAGPCTDAYMQCLNDTYDWFAPFRALMDIVCFDDYTACVYWSMIRG